MLVPYPDLVNPDPHHCLTLYLVLLLWSGLHTTPYGTDPALNGRVVLGQKHSSYVSKIFYLNAKHFVFLEIFYQLLQENYTRLRKVSQNTVTGYTVGAQSTCIARQHTTYVIIAKKPKFREFLFRKIKKEEFARRILKK
jgi:hypothetical protein